MVDNCRSSDGEVEGMTEDFKELEFLSMVNVGLTSLAKLPSLPKLRKVCLHMQFHMLTKPKLIYSGAGFDPYQYQILIPWVENTMLEQSSAALIACSQLSLSYFFFLNGDGECLNLAGTQ